MAQWLWNNQNPADPHVVPRRANDSVTRRESFENLPAWLDEVQRYTPGGEKDLVLVLCGNKSDLENERKVSTREAEAWARQRGMIFVETSAKAKIGVQQVFNEMIMKILDSPVLLGDTVSPSGRKDAGADLTQAQPEESDSCC